LEIKNLIEADDPATRMALEQHHLPPHFEIVIAPEGLPRTKPRALNIALALMRAELVTIYDAEDVPEPGQLRKAAASFHHAPPELACLQAPLVIDTGQGSRLAKLFAIEYAALFDLFNKGVAAAGLPLALGGTSNHFRGIR
jgi:cellulose synthase/poly-beta-1,6-N-acetylglucosamine synthase-like glycosyltransferase